MRDQEFNIRTGANFFADTLKGNGGDLLLSIGQYNGWFRGLTIVSSAMLRLFGWDLSTMTGRTRLLLRLVQPVAAARTILISEGVSHHRVSLSLTVDSLHQFLNGWCQNIDAYNNNFRLGKYFNLDRCE